MYYTNCIWIVMCVLDTISNTIPIKQNTKHEAFSVFTTWHSLERIWKWAVIVSLHLHEAFGKREGFFLKQSMCPNTTYRFQLISKQFSFLFWASYIHWKIELFLKRFFLNHMFMESLVRWSHLHFIQTYHLHMVLLIYSFIFQLIFE